MAVISKRSKVNIRFHNPNTTETTANYIMKRFVEANKKKVEDTVVAEKLSQISL